MTSETDTLIQVTPDSRAPCEECDHHDPDEAIVRIYQESHGRKRSLCPSHAFGCVDCGAAIGTIQPLHEWRGWLVCPNCWPARAHAAEAVAAICHQLCLELVARCYARRRFRDHDAEVA